MNQLTKLIEQYEKENPGEYSKATAPGFPGATYYYPKFVIWLASRPTCGEEQRKFLDEVENMEIGNMPNDNLYIIKTGATLYQEWFTADLQKVIKGE